jgi:hypothetical protein
MAIFTLPVELVFLIVAEIRSRQDLAHLRLTCKRFRTLGLQQQEHERRKYSSKWWLCTKDIVPETRRDSYWNAKSKLLEVSRTHPSPEAMIEAFLVAYLPSQDEALNTLYSVFLSTSYSVDFEAFLLETLYDYGRGELDVRDGIATGDLSRRFLHDGIATQKLRQSYAKDHRLSSLHQLLCDETEYCLSQNDYTTVSQRALEMCSDYLELNRCDFALELAHSLLDGLRSEFGFLAPSTQCWAQQVEGLRNLKCLATLPFKSVV